MRYLIIMSVALTVFYFFKSNNKYSSYNVLLQTGVHCHFD